MKIVALETFTQPFVGIVRVTLEDGVQGYGQVSPYQADLTAEVFHRLVAPKALGCDGTQIEEVVDHVFAEQLKYPGTFMCRAMSGLDTALWDAAGKRAGLPVYRLLGAERSEVQVYGSSMSREITSGDEADRFERLHDQHGFTAFKFRVGKKNANGRNFDAWEGRTQEMAETMARRIASRGFDLLADGNSCYDAPTAIEVGKMLHDAGCVQFEEPCRYWQYDDTRAVREALEIAVSGGEQDNYLPAWRYMLDTDVVDICQPDLCYLGGIVRSLQVAEIAAACDKPVMFHAANLSLVTLFSLHVMAALPNAGRYCEYSIEPNSFYDTGLDDLFSPALRVEDGRVALGEEPGWGIRPSEAWMQRAAYRKSGIEDVPTTKKMGAVS